MCALAVSPLDKSPFDGVLESLGLMGFCSLQVVSNVDELFDREELSAAPDPGWPDCFNSGVFVFRPSKETHDKLLKFCTEHGSFDGK